MDSNLGNCVPLAGGLGNQLFQMSAGLAMSESRKISLVSNLLNPRTDQNNSPDIFQFKLPDGIECLEIQKFGQVHRKFAFLLLKLSSTDKKLLTLRIIRMPVMILAKFLFSKAMQREIVVEISDNVGYSPKFENRHETFAIGYFQSHKWASKPDVVQLLRTIQTRHTDSEINNIKKLALIDSPLIVHFRLGDYLEEENFGIPSGNYYEEAIKFQLSSGNYNAIWAFSDDPDKALHLLPEDLNIEVKWNVSIDDSNAGTLQTMRYGKGYVIANSTFSWWGAFLSYEENPIVIAPSPWFRNLDVPKDLIPETWRQIDAF
jgi:hypothetical protein